jgi:hypothetical protein
MFSMNNNGFYSACVFCRLTISLQHGRMTVSGRVLSEYLNTKLATSSETVCGGMRAAKAQLQIGIAVMRHEDT